MIITLFIDLNCSLLFVDIEISTWTYL